MPNDRRSFLSTAGAAAVYSLAAPAQRAKAAPGSANGRVGVGFIGSGIRGTQLVDDFKAISGLQFPAACDLYDGCLARLKEQISPDIALSKDYRAILDRKDIDAVVIAVPDHLHKPLVLDALAAGKHVYIEKPLTWSLEEGPEIIRAERASGKILQVGSQPKTSALAAKTKELIQSGALGKITMVRMTNHRNNAQGAWKYEVPPDASPRTIDWKRFLGSKPDRPFDARTFFQWRCWWEFSGGVATDLFVHLLTWLHEVMGVKAPVSVASMGGLHFWKDGRDVPDVLNSIFEYEEGFIADMYVHLANSFPAPSHVIMGTKGSLVDAGNKLIFYEEPIDSGVQSYGTLQWPKAARTEYFTSRGWTPDGRPKKPSKRAEPKDILVPAGPSHAEHFILSIRNNKPSRENAEEGHLAAGAAHVANMAYRKGRKMKWDWRANVASEA